MVTAQGEGASRLGALENGEVDQWGGMESREVDRNLKIVYCFGRKMENRSVDRIGPSIAPLLQSPMLQGVVRPIVQCSIAPGREAPLCGPLIYCSKLSSLTLSGQGTGACTEVSNE